MAKEATDKEEGSGSENGKLKRAGNVTELEDAQLDRRGSPEEDEDGSDEEDEEDEEPRLKYASLTKHLKPVYRNGDATSAFLVAGDKMVSNASSTETRSGD